jgi:ribosome-binding protein aMBF1 (putative translation factor)
MTQEREGNAMNIEKRKRLEAAGWRFGNAADFLGMTPEEEAYVELKLRLADAVGAKRRAKGLTQKALAARLKSSQSRVAFMERGDPSVSVDLLIRGLFALGATRRELAKAV